MAEGSITNDFGNSSDTQVGSGEAPRNKVSEVLADPEKGRDVSVVTWLSDNDPKVSTFTEKSYLR